MAQTRPDRKAAYVNVYPAYEYSTRPSQQDANRDFDTAYDPGYLGLASPLPSPKPSIAAPTSVNKRDYKPTALRWWFLLLLIACLGAFIGMTEYAIRNLAHYNDDPIAKIITGRSVDEILVRAAAVVDFHRHPHLELARADGSENSSSPTNQPVKQTTTPPAESTTADGNAGLATGPTTVVVGTTNDKAGLQDATTVSVPPAPTTTDKDAGLQTTTTTDGGAGVVTTITAGLTTDSHAGLHDQSTVTEMTTDGVGTVTTIISSVVTMSTNGGLKTVTTVYPSTMDGNAGLATETTRDGSAGLKTEASVVGPSPDVLQTTTARGTPSVAVVQQTTTLPSAEVTMERTATAADGQTTVETYKTTVPGQTSVVQQSITVAPGEVLTTMSMVSAVTIGGTTETHATTWTDADGTSHSSSYTTVVGGSTSSVTIHTVLATPTATNTSSSGHRAGAQVLSLSETEYLAGAFLATILAVVITFPLGLISTNAKLMQPFHVLATASPVHGATAEASVFLRFYSWSGALSLPRALFQGGQPVVALADLVAGLAALLSPVAATTMSIHVGDGCMSHCFGTLGVSVAPARALQALLAAIALLLLALLVFLLTAGGGSGARGRGWRTGVGQNPWSIAGTAALCRDPELRERLRQIPRGLGDGGGRRVDEGRVLEVLGERRYALGESWEAHESSSSPAGYGVMVAGAGEASSQLLRPDETDQQHQEAEPGANLKKCQPFAVLTWWGRAGLFLLFSSVLTIVTYYGNTGMDSGFERFMDSQSFGVKFLFTALGVVLGLSMNTFFRCEYFASCPPISFCITFSRRWLS